MAEELRELRLSKQIPAKDMVAVVQAIYPKYDKTVQSKCENGDAYGVSLRPDAMAALYAHFAPELAEGRKTAKKDAHRLTCRISARLETADYGADFYIEPDAKHTHEITDTFTGGGSASEYPAHDHLPGSHLTYWMPKVNDRVLCLYLPIFNGDGFVLGGF